MFYSETNKDNIYLEVNGIAYSLDWTFELHNELVVTGSTEPFIFKLTLMNPPHEIKSFSLYFFGLRIYSGMALDLIHYQKKSRVEHAWIITNSKELREARQNNEDFVYLEIHKGDIISKVIYDFYIKNGKVVTLDKTWDVYAPRNYKIVISDKKLDDLLKDIARWLEGTVTFNQTVLNAGAIKQGQFFDKSGMAIQGIGLSSGLVLEDIDMFGMYKEGMGEGIPNTDKKEKSLSGNQIKFDHIYGKNRESMNENYATGDTVIQKTPTKPKFPTVMLGSVMYVDYTIDTTNNDDMGEYNVIPYKITSNKMKSFGSSIKENTKVTLIQPGAFHQKDSKVIQEVNYRWSTREGLQCTFATRKKSEIEKDLQKMKAFQSSKNMYNQR